ncbi:MAG: ferrochelatase [Deltaproteobacteria bacterium]|nr:ferrochelatase [Deltaproteobacteria bacterium]
MSSARAETPAKSLSYQAVLLISFGGPTAAAEIRPFLARVLKGIPIPKERVEEVVRHYEAVGGRSPLNDITFRQAESLQRLLNEQGLPLPVYVGMRNSSPFLAETLKRMGKDGISRALGFILSSHQSEASWERYQKNVADARNELDGLAPEIDYCPGWHAHPLFIRTLAELIQPCLDSVEERNRFRTPLIFTAHSLPVAMASRSPYVEQVQETSQLIADRLSHRRWSVAYQSRSGRPTDPWLEPDIGQAIRDLTAEAASAVIVAPIGFVSDHVEVLYDLDIEARKVAEDLGLRFLRASCPNDQPTFIQMMAAVIQASVQGTP